MASPRWQNEYNQHHRNILGSWINAIMSGNPELINQVLRPREHKPGATTPERLLEDYKPLMRRIASDYINLGGMSAETQALAAGYNPHLGVKHNKGTRESAANATNLVFKSFLSTLPTVTQGREGQTSITMLGKPAGMSDEEYLQSTIANQALKYTDPAGATEMRAQLYRSNPEMFRAFGFDKPAAQPTAIGEETNRVAQAGRLTNFAADLDYNKLRQTLGQYSGVQNQTAGMGATNWLRNYLTTAAGGLTGTRAQQHLTQQRLTSLEKEAEGNQMGGYLGIARSLVNPLGRRASASNIIGQGRAVPLAAGRRNPGLL